MRPLRVLMVSHLFPPAAAGGSEIQAYRLARGLAQRGVKVVIATAGSAPTLFDPSSGIQIVKFRSKGDPRRMSSLRRLAHAAVVYRTVTALVQQADLLHLHGVHFTHTTLPSLMAARRCRVPCVLKIPSTGPEEFLEYYGWMPLSGRIHRWVLSCDAVVAVCKIGYERAIEAGIDPRRMHLVPNGIDLSRNSAEDSAGQKEETEPYFLFCASLDHYRGWDLLLKAWETAAPQLREWKLRIAGYHPEEDRIRKEIERRWGERVVFHGYLQDVSSLMRQAACLIRPSRRDGISNSILEAMSVRTPVIASDAGGNPELVRHGWNGLLFPSEDVRRLASRLVEMAACSSEQRARMGEHAYRHVLEGFSMERVVSAYLNLYRQVLV